MQHLKRLIALLALLSIIQVAIPVDASRRQYISVRTLLEEYRNQRADISVELLDGKALSGFVRRTERARFHMLDDIGQEALVIDYSDVRSVTERTTGERVDFQPPGPTAQFPPVHTSLKAWVIAGIVVGSIAVILSILFHGD